MFFINWWHSFWVSPHTSHLVGVYEFDFSMSFVVFVESLAAFICGPYMSISLETSSIFTLDVYASLGCKEIFIFISVGVCGVYLASGVIINGAYFL